MHVQALGEKQRWMAMQAFEHFRMTTPLAKIVYKHLSALCCTLPKDCHGWCGSSQKWAAEMLASGRDTKFQVKIAVHSAGNQPGRLLKSVSPYK